MMCATHSWKRDKKAKIDNDMKIKHKFQIVTVFFGSLFFHEYKDYSAKTISIKGSFFLGSWLANDGICLWMAQYFGAKNIIGTKRMD